MGRIVEMRTIPLDEPIYQRLIDAAHPGESPSDVVARLLDEVGDPHTGRSIQDRLRDLPDLGEGDAEVFYGIVGQNRHTGDWRPRSAP